MKLFDCRLYLFLFLLPVQITNATKLSDCIHNILDRHRQINNKKILMNFDLVLKYPVYKVHPSIYETKLIDIRFDIFILRYHGRSNIRRFIAWDSERVFFNPNANYILFVDDVSPEIFGMFAEYYIRKVYLVTKRFGIFTFSPYILESVDNPDRTPLYMGYCNDRRTIGDLFKVEFPKLWRNTTLKNCFRVLEPYTTQENNGLENQFLEVLQKHLGFKRQTIIVPENDVNEMDPFSKEGILLLKTRKADVLSGFNSPDYHIPRYLDVTASFYVDAISWVSPYSPLMSHWSRMAKIFPSVFWYHLVASSLIWIILVKSIDRIRIFDMIVMLYQILLENSVSQYYIMNKFYFKIMLAVWMVGFLVLSTLFKNNLLVIMGTQKRVPQLLTVKQVLDPRLNLKITSYINLSSVYLDSQGHKDYPIDFDEVEECRSVLECVNRTAFYRDSVTTAPKGIVRYNWIPKFYITDFGEVLVRPSQENVKPLYIHLFLSKGYPMFDQINNILIRLTAGGWFDHVYNEMRLKIKRATSPLVFEAQKIGMDKFKSVFGIWAIGLLCSLVVFCCEVLCCKKLGEIKILKGLKSKK